MGKIDRTQYKQLDLILWDTRSRFVREDRAFYAYEKKWGFVDKAALTRGEHQLIDQLTKTIGGGRFMPAA